MDLIELTSDEVDLLDWLAKEDVSALVECHGKALDGLVAKGLAVISYQAVMPTDAGFRVASGAVAFEHTGPLTLMDAWCFWAWIQGHDERLILNASKWLKR